MDDLDRRIAALAAEGFSDRALAREVGLSRTAVRKRRAKIAAAAESADDTDTDPWTDDATEDDLALYDDDAERTWPPEPFHFVGYERTYFPRGRGEPGYWADVPRWVDGDGHSVGDEYESAEMALYRYANHVADELDDREHARELAEDWQRQRDEYDARQRARRA